MIIKASYSEMVNVLNLMSLVTSSKTIQEGYKSINLFVKDNKLHALSTDGKLFCMNSFDGEYDLEGETNPFMVITIKEISDILSKYSSLQRTQVKEVVLSTQQKGVVLTVVEEPKEVKGDSNFAFSDMYKNQSGRYKLSRSDVKPLITRELPTIVLPDGAIEVQSKELQKYLDYMYAPMSKPRDTVVLNFIDEFVYSIMGNVFGIAMPNNLPKEIFKDLSISLPYMNFLRNIISMNDTFKVYKEVTKKKIPQSGVPEDQWPTQVSIVLYIKSGNTLIKLNTIDISAQGKISTFKTDLPNSVEVDKPYLIDTLKRIEGDDQVYIEIDITEDEVVAGSSKAEFTIKTARTIQKIPVKSAVGSGSFRIMLRPESLNLMVFNHLTKDMDGNTDKVNDIVFFMDILEKDMVSLCCRDKTDDWQTRYPRAPLREAPLLDF